MLQDIIDLRTRVISDHPRSYGFDGELLIANGSDIGLLQRIAGSCLRQLQIKKTQLAISCNQLKIGDVVLISVDTSKVNGYYETFENLITANKYEIPTCDFYVHDLNFQDSSGGKKLLVDNYKSIVGIIDFLSHISTYNQTSKGIKTLLFQKPGRVCSLQIVYNENILKSIKSRIDVNEINRHVLGNKDEEARIRLFNIELLNILSKTEESFISIIENWNEIINSYKKSFALYLSEFSFQQIKTSSQEYFHELTDRIYSTVQKFSTYIFAIPVAYILILRFFDFTGENFAKDTFLLLISVLYFFIIWFVILNNLTSAFQAIEHDIERFLVRIESESSLKEIVCDLKAQKDNIIPDQRKKILLVRTISITILVITLIAYIWIHHEYLLQIINQCIINNFALFLGLII